MQCCTMSSRLSCCFFADFAGSPLLWYWVDCWDQRHYWIHSWTVWAHQVKPAWPVDCGQRTGLSCYRFRHCSSNRSGSSRTRLDILVQFSSWRRIIIQKLAIDMFLVSVCNIISVFLLLLIITVTKHIWQWRSFYDNVLINQIYIFIIYAIMQLNLYLLKETLHRMI